MQSLSRNLLIVIYIIIFRHTWGWYAAECLLWPHVYMCKDRQYTPAVCVRVCVCDRSGRTVCQRKIIIHLKCWSPWHLFTGKKRIFLEREIFTSLVERHSGHAAPTRTHLSIANGLFIENTFCPTACHISPRHNLYVILQIRTMKQPAAKTSDTVFTFPFGLLCFFHGYVFFHFRSRATQGTETEYILHYVAVTFASVFKFIILWDVLWIYRL